MGFNLGGGSEESGMSCEVEMPGREESWLARMTQLFDLEMLASSKIIQRPDIR